MPCAVTCATVCTFLSAALWSLGVIEQSALKRLVQDLADADGDARRKACSLLRDVATKLKALKRRDEGETTDEDADASNSGIERASPAAPAAAGAATASDTRRQVAGEQTLEFGDEVSLSRVLQYFDVRVLC